MRFYDVPHTICYSVKANSNLSILRLLAREGCGFDVVSGGELERVLAADRRAARRIVFSGVGKSREEMTAALKAGIFSSMWRANRNSGLSRNVRRGCARLLAWRFA